ncbi:MAG: glycoside hydrolase family 2 [Lachnospiraceae bacterium]|nr:glycoside hydrolase family 2 [Lachnospiraceae bacterium]
MKQLYTKWGRSLDPSHILEEYPRPQMVRNNYINLNGYWDYAIESIGARDVQKKFPTKSDGKILVPFSPETVLSGVNKTLHPGEYLWYKRSFHYEVCPGHLLLHFNAVDQVCSLYINDVFILSHTGGYLPFSADITPFLHGGENTITLRVTDDTDESYHARGKQVLERGGMFYTPQSGIWQSVWAEYVPDEYINSIELTPNLSPDLIRILVKGVTKSYCKIKVSIFAPKIYEDLKEKPSDIISTSIHSLGEEFIIQIDDGCYWTPESPYLYYCDIELLNKEGLCCDKVRSYFALRSFSLKYCKDEDFPRVALNDEVIFQQGVLDQGYWPESLLTPPSDEAMIWDLCEMKRTGFNMVRKHIKIEPERWYYHCDRLGLIVWQDMVNGGGKIKQWFVTYAATPLSIKRVRVSDKLYPLFSRTDKEGQKEFKNEMVSTILLLKNHPSICTWVIFNEGWGQFHTTRMTLLAKKTDPSRLIDQASGWFDQRGGDFFSIHNYFFELTVTPEKRRANVLSEIGGIVYKIEDHSCVEGSYGYSVCNSREELNASYEKIQDKLRSLIPKGLCGSVYTQWTDIEEETNGVYTYDREIRKIDGSKIR